MSPLFLILAGCLVLNNSTTAVYQQGFYDGCKAGLEMGYWQGGASYSSDAYQGMGDVCQQFNLMLTKVFGPDDNRTKELWQDKPDNPYAEDQQSSTSIDPYAAYRSPDDLGEV